MVYPLRRNRTNPETQWHWILGLIWSIIGRNAFASIAWPSDLTRSSSQRLGGSTKAEGVSARRNAVLHTRLDRCGSSEGQGTGAELVQSEARLYSGLS